MKRLVHAWKCYQAKRKVRLLVRKYKQYNIESLLRILLNYYIQHRVLGLCFNIKELHSCKIINTPQQDFLQEYINLNKPSEYINSNIKLNKFDRFWWFRLSSFWTDQDVDALGFMQRCMFLEHLLYPDYKGRHISVLLKLVLHRVISGLGMCWSIGYLQTNRYISDEEYYYLKRMLEYTRPYAEIAFNASSDDSYWWDRHESYPRKQFLQSLIDYHEKTT